MEAMRKSDFPRHARHEGKGPHLEPILGKPALAELAPGATAGRGSKAWSEAWSEGWRKSTPIESGLPRAVPLFTKIEGSREGTVRSRGAGISSARAAGPKEPARPKEPESADVATRCTTLLADFAASQDPQRFNELAELADPFLRRRAGIELLRVGASIDEQEVVQETLLNIYRYAHTFRPNVPHAFSTWACTVVRNVVLRFLRRRKSWRVVSLEELQGFDVSDETLTDPARGLLEEEERSALSRCFSLYLLAYYEAFKKLTNLQKRILHLVEIDGFKYREIGEQLGMRVEAVKMVVFRARRRLMSEMARVTEEPETAH